MSYIFKIDNHDYSMYVNKLQVGTEHHYQQKSSAGGADKITHKYKRRIIEVGIIPLDDAAMMSLLSDVDKFRVSVSFRDPLTNTLVENLSCIIPNHIVEYYTIQVGNVKYKAFSLQLQEVNYIGEVG